MMEMVAPFGYEYVDGKMIPHPIESAILKFRVEKYLEYIVNPPATLIHDVMEEALAEGEILTEEDAKARVRNDSIDRYVLAEIFKNPEWKNYLESKKAQIPAIHVDAYQSTVKSFTTDKGVTVMAHEGIIDPETWANAQGKMKESMESRFGKIVFETE